MGALMLTEVRFARLGGAWVLLLVAGCRMPARSMEEPAAVAVAELDPSGEPRRCGISLASGTTAEEHAVRCAEWFVSRNGYTLLRPADPARVAREPLDSALSVDALLARRRGTLDPRAVAVCRTPPDGTGFAFMVGFAYRAEYPPPNGRAVTMDSAFADLRMQHRGISLISALGDTAHCDAANTGQRRPDA